MNNDAQPAPAKTQPPRPTLATLLASIGVIVASIWFCCSGVMCSGPGSSVRDIADVPASGNTPEEETVKFREIVASHLPKKQLSFLINDHFRTPSRKVIQVRYQLQGKTEFGICMDIEQILRAVDESQIDCAKLTVFGSTELVDQFGNKSNDVVVKATFSGDTIDRINWSNFSTANVLKISDNATLHPAMRE